jgi:hypothetical protein
MTRNSEHSSTQFWHFLVQDYSQRKLTNSRDILVALSGVVHQLSKAYGEDYLAGLWRYNLPTSLLWKSGAFSRRTDGFVAPTFSWASRVGSITFTEREEHHKLECTVISASCTTNGRTKSYGPIKEGVLSLTGRLVSCNFDRLEFRDETRGSGMRVQKDEEFDVFILDTIEDESQPPRQELFCFEVMSYPKLKYYYDEYGIRYPPWKSQVDEAKTAIWYSHALLLKRADDNVEKFQRIGIADKIPKHWFEIVEKREVQIA